MRKEIMAGYFAPFIPWVSSNFSTSVFLEANRCIKPAINKPKRKKEQAKGTCPKVQESYLEYDVRSSIWELKL